MKYKSEIQNILKYLFSYVNTQFNTFVNRIRVDNVLEFSSIKDFFLEQRVLFKHSCTYVPQQNGDVERKQRHILNVARALRFQAIYF